MALSVDQIPIESPCPIDLDPARTDAARRSWHCSHCDKRVHVLSNMTEDEARAFLSERDGQNLCVSYLQRPDCTIKFREPARLIPIQALAPRRLALGFGAALAACTPTEPPPKPSVPTIEVRADATPTRSQSDKEGLGDLVQKFKAEAPKAPPEEPKVEPPKPPEPEELVPYDGGITARALPPPVAPPSPPTMMKRGGMRRAP